MKKLFFIFCILFTIVSCDKNLNYYEQITRDKSITERVDDLNKDSQEIRKSEKGKLTKEELDYMEYEYKIGKGDSYVISYLFDELGVYEIGFDGYFANKEDAKLVLDEFKKEISLTDFGEPQETPRLKRWLKPDKSVTVELDYTDVDKGMAVVTIFANE